MKREKPREIVVRAKDGGSANPDFRTMGLAARDTQTGANLWVPGPILRDGVQMAGRNAAQAVADALLMAQGSTGRASWDRSTTDTDVFTVWDA